MQKIAPIKIILAGDGGTGKSTLIATKNTGHFSYASAITIGVDFACLDIPSEKQIKKSTFLIYDLGGQKRFQFLHDSYIIGAKGAILLYDLTRESTFDHLRDWIQLLLKENPKMPIILAGSKRDLANPEDLTYYRQKLLKLSRSLSLTKNIQAHMFISSKTLEGVDEIFQKFSEILDINDSKAFLPKSILNRPYFPSEII
ncbi:MAG: Rab family GTPase [Promethearchaeota archaeon]